MSRKEEKRRVKEAKKAAAQSREKLTGLLVKVAIVILVPLALFVFGQGLFTNATVAPPDEITESDHVRGNPDAPVTLTVYADFQCPACLTETELIARAYPRISNDAKIVFRHYPLDNHRHAFLAARYAEAASMQEHFWSMHDYLYANQPLWESLPDATEVFDGFAKDIGMDLDKLHADMELGSIRDKIIADQRGGTRAGVRATPSIFLNGKLIPNPRTATELVQLVAEASAQ